MDVGEMEVLLKLIRRFERWFASTGKSSRRFGMR